MITHTQVVTVCVHDQEKALQFYTDSLGFEVRTDVPMGPNARWIEVAPKGAQTTFVLYTPPGMESRIGGFTGICLNSNDLSKTYNELSAKGVKFTKPPQKESWGAQAQFSDPDGNEFLIVQTP